MRPSQAVVNQKRGPSNNRTGPCYWLRHDPPPTPGRHRSIYAWPKSHVVKTGSKTSELDHRAWMPSAERRKASYCALGSTLLNPPSAQRFFHSCMWKKAPCLQRPPRALTACDSSYSCEKHEGARVGGWLARGRASGQVVQRARRAGLRGGRHAQKRSQRARSSAGWSEACWNDAGQSEAG